MGFPEDIPSKVVAIVPKREEDGDVNLFRLKDWVSPQDSRTQSPLFIAYGMCAGPLHSKSMFRCDLVEMTV